MTRGDTTSRVRRVAVVTGTRAEYGLLASPMQHIQAHPRLKLQLVVTGTHLLRKFGSTVRYIERDGWRIDARIPMQRGHDDPADQADGLARGIKGIAAYLQRARTDVVLVLGDRIEALAGALAATTTARFVAHIHGGDVAPGDLDDTLRYTITRLAHIHFAASQDAADRIVRFGEHPSTVHRVGAPGLDHLMKRCGEAATRRGNNTVLVVQHACGRSAVIEERAMMAILRAVADHHLTPTIIHPNSDRGHSGVVAAINKSLARRNGNPRPRLVKSLDRDRYLDTLAAARLLIGNSSSGILEAPVLGVASVNVGNRQQGRLPAGSSVVNSAESYAAMMKAIEVALNKRPRILRQTPYGDGNAGRRIARILATTALTDSRRRKPVSI